MTRIDEIKARLRAATPGPWEYHQDPFKEFLPDGDYSWLYSIWKGNRAVALPSNAREFRGTVTCLQHNAKFIAAAPDDIAYLLSEVERLQEVVRIALRDVEGAERALSGKYAMGERLDAADAEAIEYLEHAAVGLGVFGGN